MRAIFIYDNLSSNDLLPECLTKFNLRSLSLSTVVTEMASEPNNFLFTLVIIGGSFYFRVIYLFNFGDPDIFILSLFFISLTLSLKRRLLLFILSFLSPCFLSFLSSRFLSFLEDLGCFSYLSLLLLCFLEPLERLLESFL